MGKLSNESDSEKRRIKRSHQSNSWRRSSSSESSSSRSKYKKSSKNSKRRSRSRSSDRYHRSRRSRSGSRHYKSKSKRHLKEYRSRRSSSRDKHRSRRSRSKDYIKEYISKKRSSSSSSSTYSSNTTSSSERAKLKIGKNVEISTTRMKSDDKDFDIPPMDSEVLDEINTDSFAQKSFSSKKKKLPNTIVIDLKKQTIKVPEVEPVEPDSIFHHNLFLSEEARSEKWVKELYVYRQKALQQGVKK